MPPSKSTEFVGLKLQCRVTRCHVTLGQRILGARKAFIVSVCALLICVAVSCRDQSYWIPPIDDMQAEEARAIERQNARRVAADSNPELEFLKAMNATTPEQATELESEVKANPEALDARENLIYFYSNHISSKPIIRYPKDSPLDGWGPPIVNALALRRTHILWMVRHHPEHRVFQNEVAIPNPYRSGLNADPATYAEAKTLWLEHIGSSNPDVLRNSALFFEPTDKAQAEQIFLRAQAVHPDPEWTSRLGHLYAFGLIGVTDTLWTNYQRPLIGGFIQATSEAEAHSAFARAVQKKLDTSSDAQLLNAAGQNLLTKRPVGPAELRPAAPALAYKYFDRAVRLDPQLVEAHIPLAKMRIRQANPETRAILQKTDKEKKLGVIATLPAAERFVVLGEMARYSYDQANIGEVIDPGTNGFKTSDRDWTSDTLSQAKRYAEELLKLAPSLHNDPGYSGALFTAHVLLATISAESGNNSEAVLYMRGASRIPPSEEMAYSPPHVPYIFLSQLLAAKGYRSDAIAFLEHFATSNVSERDGALVVAAQLRVENSR